MSIKLYIGCGPHRHEDFKGVDIFPGPAVDIIASAEKLPFEDNSVDEILSEHLIEHLTFFEFNKTMAEWYRVLKPGGLLTIECPDLLGVCKLFVEQNEYGRYHSFKGYWPLIAHFFGHQRGRNKEEELSQVHKSGYTVDHLIEVLCGLGYDPETSKLEEPRKANPYSPTIRVSIRKYE